MGAKVSRSDFEWSYTEEPHATRRRVIMEKHPEIKQLFGTDPAFRYVVCAIIITQIVCGYLLKDSVWWLIVLQAYCAGGTMNHALTLAIHEISHNIAFGNSFPMKNRLLGMLANLPLGLPMSVSFKKYHIEHHRYLGEEVLDTDIPTELEAKLFDRTWTKFIWLALQPFFYTIRPVIIYKKSITDMEVLNAIVQLVFDYAIYQYFGYKALLYFIISTFISLGLHPTAGHFIAEHYVFTPGQETYTYVGPLNMVTFNVGYHVEHHDFPFIAGDKLPMVRKLAPEFYEHLQTHTSWVWVLWQFVFNPSIGPYARIKRKARVEPKYFGVNMLDEYVNAILHFFGYYQVKEWMGNLFSSLTGNSATAGGSENRPKKG